MKVLARALINAAATRSGRRSAGRSGFALQALEEIALNLSYCSAEEKQALG